MQKFTACPLDCYDACKIVIEGDKLIGDTSHPAGNGALCAVLNKYIDETERITVITSYSIHYTKLYEKIINAITKYST